ncbi:MAG: GDP-mannose 4,6-dehydratase, partial [bacterium]
VLHLAAQVAVTTSVADPREDFEVNALGTFNLLEAIRASKTNPIVIYSSTNKVYGGMEKVEVVERNNRYRYKDFDQGIPESIQLDFHSPYGCSKGAADQYVRDYSRIYGMRTVVLRQSCIYGYRQFGVEDQGWVAWFIIAAQLGKPITIYGDGKQVRDILFIEDLIDAFDLAIKKIAKVSGRVFNIGGGPKNQMSLLELLGMIEKLAGKAPEFSFSDWRPGDQRVYVSSIEKAAAELGWKPKTDMKTGIKRLFDWVAENRQMLKNLF